LNQAATAPWRHTEQVLECTNKSPLFFPPDYTQTFAGDIARARALCRACPLQPACLEWALSQTGLEGVWGGTTPADRRRIRRQRAA
jgi:WhiB family redox-sensing transcriptional regulator